MFGFVNANWQELDESQKQRYGAVYCGICRAIHRKTGNLARLTLSYDMAFLALLHMSLYEPQEQTGQFRCLAHPAKRRQWLQNDCIDYAADMNVALAYYKALDDVQDEGKAGARYLVRNLEPYQEDIHRRWPRQTDAIRDCITQLGSLEKAGTENPDLPAACFGRLMAELMVLKEDMWSEDLRCLGFHLGRFIYLADAILDYDRDKRKKQYNPLLFQKKEPAQWEEYLVLAMGRCTESYERLPLVQDKPLLDNILYSGVWVQYRGKMKKEDSDG